MRPPVKSKNQGTERSGRGIGIPVAGAIGGGDGFQQKVGRPRRPVLQGDMGSPRQSADSAFSSALSRVNKGREDDTEYAHKEMFPNQADDFDPELDDDLLGMRTRKLPIYFAGMKRIPEGREVREMRGFGKPKLSHSLLRESADKRVIREFSLDDIASSTAYKTVENIFDAVGSAFGITKPIYKTVTRAAPALTKAAETSLKAAGTGALASAPKAVAAPAAAAASFVGAVPGLDVAYGFGASYYNFRQIQRNIDRLNMIMQDSELGISFTEILEMPAGDFASAVGELDYLNVSSRNDLRRELEDMMHNVKDIVVAVILMSDTLSGLTFMGPVVGVASAAATASAAIAVSFADDYVGMMNRTADFFLKLPDPVKGLIDDGIREISGSMTFDKFITLIQRCATFYDRLLNPGPYEETLAEEDSDPLYPSVATRETSSATPIANPFLEGVRKKKKVAPKNEFSSVGGGSITGYVGKLSDFPTEKRRKDFEKTAAKSYGGSHLDEEEYDERLDESSRFKVGGRRSIIKALLD